MKFPTPELFQLSIAAYGIVYYAVFHQWGKLLYWGGVVILTLGLSMMKG